MQDIIKFTITGNQQKLKKLIEDHSLTANDIYDTRGFAVKAYDPEKTIMNTREWNPFHFAIFFRQLPVLKYLTGLPGVNLKIALDFHHTSNEFAVEPMFKEAIGNQNGNLFGLVLAIYARDLHIFTYLYEDQSLLSEEQDLIRILRVCLKAEWLYGFMKIIKSVKTTEKLFCNSSYDFKEEYIQFILSPSTLQSDCINPNNHEAEVKEVRERLC